MLRLCKRQNASKKDGAGNDNEIVVDKSDRASKDVALSNSFLDLPEHEAPALQQKKKKKSFLGRRSNTSDSKETDVQLSNVNEDASKANKGTASATIEAAPAASSLPTDRALYNAMQTIEKFYEHFPDGRLDHPSEINDVAHNQASNNLGKNQPEDDKMGKQPSLANQHNHGELMNVPGRNLAKSSSNPKHVRTGNSSTEKGQQKERNGLSSPASTNSRTNLKNRFNDFPSSSSFDSFQPERAPDAKAPIMLIPVDNLILRPLRAGAGKAGVTPSSGIMSCNTSVAKEPLTVATVESSTQLVHPTSISKPPSVAGEQEMQSSPPCLSERFNAAAAKLNSQKNVNPVSSLNNRTISGSGIESPVEDGRRLKEALSVEGNNPNVTHHISATEQTSRQGISQLQSFPENAAGPTIFLNPAEAAIFLSLCKEMPSRQESFHGSGRADSKFYYPTSTALRAVGDNSNDATHIASSIVRDTGSFDSNHRFPNASSKESRSSLDFLTSPGKGAAEAERNGNVDNRDKRNGGANGDIQQKADEASAQWNLSDIMYKLFSLQRQGNKGDECNTESPHGVTEPGGVRNATADKNVAQSGALITGSSSPNILPTFGTNQEIFIPINDESIDADPGPMQGHITEAVKTAIAEAVANNTFNEDVEAAEESGGSAGNDVSSGATRGVFIDFAALPANVQRAIQENSQYVADRVGGIGTSLRQGDVKGLRGQVAELVEFGGPEVSGIWASVKVCLGIATIVAGHAMFGAAMIVWGTGAIGGAVLWGAHREQVRQWIAGHPLSQAGSNADTVEEGDEHDEADINMQSKEDNICKENSSGKEGSTTRHGLSSGFLSSPINEERSFHSANAEALDEYYSIEDTSPVPSPDPSIYVSKDLSKDGGGGGGMTEEECLSVAGGQKQNSETQASTNSRGKGVGGEAVGIFSKLSGKLGSFSPSARRSVSQLSGGSRGFLSSPVRRQSSSLASAPPPASQKKSSGGRGSSSSTDTSTQNISWWQRYIARTPPTKKPEEQPLFESRVADEIINKPNAN